jgi:hypothetical protein
MTTLLFTGLLLALSATILSWSTVEGRINRAHTDRLAALNAADALAQHAANQISFQSQSVTDYTVFGQPGNAQFQLNALPADFFAGTDIDPAHIEMVAKVTPPATGTSEKFGEEPYEKYSDIKKTQGPRGVINILARASTRPNAQGKRQSIYLSRTVSIIDEPILKYAVFYNTDLEIAPGPPLNIYGPVHTNGNLWVSKQSNEGNLRFWADVTAVGYIRKGFKVQPLRSDNSREVSATHPHIQFKAPGGFVNLYGPWNGSDRWRDQANITLPSDFQNFTSATYGSPSSLQTSAHSVEARKLPGQLDNYVPDPNPTNTTIETAYRNVARALIERPLFPGDVEYMGPEVEKQKMSRKAGLYILVNASNQPRPARRPDGVAIGNLAVGEYVAWVRRNNVYVTVQLPGQDAATPVGYPAHPYVAAQAAVGATPDVRPVIQVRQNRMTDLRRYTTFNFNQDRTAVNRYIPKVINTIDVDMTALKLAVDVTVNNAASSMIFPYNSNAPVSLPGAAIGSGEIDGYFLNYQARFDPTVPINEYGVTNGAREGLIVHQPDGRYRINNMLQSDWDGSIYIESLDADYVNIAYPVPGPTADGSPALPGLPATAVPGVTGLSWTVQASGATWSRRQPGHRQSGVRLINGRGPVASASLATQATLQCRPGLTLSTNDAMYIWGHLNADGRIQTTLIAPTAAQLADVNTTDGALDGNNSSIFRDPLLRPAVANCPQEEPLALFADAITILSQPEYSAATPFGPPVRGWQDSTSGWTKDTNDWRSNWDTSVPDGNNKHDGTSSGNNPPVPGVGGVDIKRVAGATEISAGFIIGLTPSANNPADPNFAGSVGDGQNSGGLHNLPRFIEHWGRPFGAANGTPPITCAIRGSMIVMFESKVAWEPWSLRVYTPPNRQWGFHNYFGNFRLPDDIPPVRRVGTTPLDTNQLITRAQYLQQRDTVMWPGLYTTVPPP